ncbi:MAG: FHA domain-containing protein [Steroidobacteraceae bacterium]
MSDKPDTPAPQSWDEDPDRTERLPELALDEPAALESRVRELESELVALEDRLREQGGIIAGLEASLAEAREAVEQLTRERDELRESGGQVAVEQARTQSLPPPVFRPALVRVDDDHGDRIELCGSDLTIGRTPDNDLPIRHASVSRRHARVVMAAEGVCIEDAGSRNGLIVNERRAHRAVLSHGDIIQLGQVQLRFEAASP